MREIKFRGKRESNGEWVYGYLCENINGEICIQEIVRKVVNSFAIPNRLHPVNPATIGQYTGMRDKNGREIYEEDIVVYTNYHSYFYKVVFSVGCFRLADKDGDVWYNLNECDAEVCGNIHNNPELLEQ